MKTARFCSMGIILILMSSILQGQVFERLEDNRGLSDVTTVSGTDSPVSIWIIYDNYVAREGTRSDWGFSVFIEGLEKGILFDTGTRPDIFENNFRVIGIDPSSIDLLVFSHEHRDHTGGTSSFVKMRTGIPVLMPESFTPDFIQTMADMGLKPVLVNAPSKICRNLFTSGEFQFEIPEEALVIDTKKGLVVITGCAHPGIITMLRKIKKDFGKNVYMVLGGFHLMDKNEEEMIPIISDMKVLGVVRCGATHCTGAKQIGMIRESFGGNFVEMGTGNKITIDYY